MGPGWAVGLTIAEVVQACWSEVPIPGGLFSVRFGSRVTHKAVPEPFFEGPQVFFGDVVHETPF
jgi:hypothetical protein